MSDVAQEGQSSVINEDSLGNDRMWHVSCAKITILMLLQRAGSIILGISSIW